jgi:tRNA (guanine37-N1)-methyltransferase
MSLRDDLKGAVPDEKLSLVPNRFSTVGDIAVISCPVELNEFKGRIAEAILSRNRNIRTVVNKTSKTKGESRVASFEILAGTDTVTTHVEFGFLYRLNLGKVFFNSHLAYEHNRVASKSRPGELVLIPFAGVGPFAVPVAAFGAWVVALEKSAEACRWLAENARLNRVDDRIETINGDALFLDKMFGCDFDRAVVPTPYGMDEILEVVYPLVKAGGTIHFYTFKRPQQIGGLVQSYRSLGLDTEFFRRCGNVAPGVSRWAFDLVKL